MDNEKNNQNDRVCTYNSDAYLNYDDENDQAKDPPQYDATIIKPAQASELIDFEDMTGLEYIRVEDLFTEPFKVVTVSKCPLADKSIIKKKLVNDTQGDDKNEDDEVYSVAVPIKKVYKVSNSYSDDQAKLISYLHWWLQVHSGLIDKLTRSTIESLISCVGNLTDANFVLNAIKTMIDIRDQEWMKHRETIVEDARRATRKDNKAFGKKIEQEEKDRQFNNDMSLLMNECDGNLSKAARRYFDIHEEDELNKYINRYVKKNNKKPQGGHWKKEAKSKITKAIQQRYRRKTLD